ncbi:MAG: protein kinase domain-containing protein, partial [Planctomycetota bacterium]
LLTDFGLAKDIASESKMTRSGMTLGTPAYMPPEQAEGRLDDIDERSDVYSLGATLYEMLALRPPFEGSAVANVIKHVLLDEPLSPRRLNRLVAKDLETICLKCLEKKPEKRYSSAGELAQDLGRFLEGAPIHARPPSMIEKLVKKARRHKGVTVTAFIAALLLVAGGIFSLHTIAKGERKTEQEKERATQAESGKARAEQLLDKNRKVTRILLGAHMKLGRIHGKLKKTFYDEMNDTADKRRVFRKHEAEIQAFLSTVEPDPTSQATRYAVEGWLMWLGDFEEEALALFEKSRKADGDVGWGFLFEAMAWLSRYLQAQPLPKIIGKDTGFAFGEVPPETASMKASRERFETLIDAAGQAIVWGGGTATAFQEVLDAFRGMQKQDFDATEKGLGRALDLTEMAWMEEEILLARLKVRIPIRDFDGGIRDVEALRERGFENSQTAFFYGCLLAARGAETLGRGRDPREDFRKALEVYERELRRNPDHFSAYLNWGTTYNFLGDAESKRGVDPRGSYGRAIEILEVGRRRGQKSPTLYGNLGRAYASLGQSNANRGLDPMPDYQKAIEILDRCLELNPKEYTAAYNRAKIHFRVGTALEDRGRDPTPAFRSALEDCEKAIGLDPDPPHPYATRGGIYDALGKEEEVRGRDGRGNFSRAMDECTIALEKDPH